MMGDFLQCIHEWLRIGGDADGSGKLSRKELEALFGDDQKALVVMMQSCRKS